MFLLGYFALIKEIIIRFTTQSDANENSRFKVGFHSSFLQQELERERKKMYKFIRLKEKYVVFFPAGNSRIEFNFFLLT